MVVPIQLAFAFTSHKILNFMHKLICVHTVHYDSMLEPSVHICHGNENFRIGCTSVFDRAVRTGFERFSHR